MSEDTRTRPGTRRRRLLKAVGAGAVLTTVGGSAAAQTAADGGDGAGEGETSGDAESARPTGTVHRVETLIEEPPTDPERPADFFYQPTGLYVSPGDVVKWVFRSPDHNVVSVHPAFGMRRRVPTGVTAFSSPLLGYRPESIPGDQVEPPAEGEGATDRPEPDTWLHTFETPGVYDLVCSPHEGFGMAMRIVVGEESTAPFETSDPEALPEPRAGPVGLARVTLTDPALEPETIVEEGTVAWSGLESVTEAAAETPTGAPGTEGTPGE